MPAESTYIGYAVFVFILLILLIKSIVIVKEKTAVIFERLGRFKRVANPGLTLIIPFIDRKAAVMNLRIQQLDVGVETKTLDNVFVNLKVSLQYQVSANKAKEAYYSLENAGNQIASYIFDDVRAEVPKLELDEVFSKKDDIAVAVRNNIAEAMEIYGYLIVKTLITDIDPDHKVKESMNRINAAMRDKEAMVQEAEAKKIKIIKEAEAEAESKRLAGEGMARQRLEIVKGFKESVEDFQRSLKNVSHEEVMQFVLLTQYFDTLSTVGANSKNTSILMPHSPSAMKDFQSQIIEGTYIGKKLADDQETNNNDKGLV
jgi:regulator of protease activity HflC (stomatin/prohibitin superfamily)